VPGVGVDADDAGHLALDAGLLECLADRGLRDGLPKVDGAAGKSPVAVVRATDQQEIAILVDDCDIHRRHKAVRPRCQRVVVSSRSSTGSRTRPDHGKGQVRGGAKLSFVS
jgi:hypothetical protein